MRQMWLEVVHRVLRPARPDLERCLRERDRFVVDRDRVEEGRAQKLARCRARIEDARAEVFAAQDGVVGARMTDLEREWRMLARKDRDQGIMDLWARVAPRAWIDRKLWRGHASAVDAAVALASDPSGVERAESCVRALGYDRVRWGALEQEWDGVFVMFAERLRETLASRPDFPALVRARDLEREIHEAAIAEHPTRPMLARSIAHAAFADFIFGKESPVTPLRSLWLAGYTIASVDGTCVTLELPPL